MEYSVLNLRVFEPIPMETYLICICENQRCSSTCTSICFSLPKYYNSKSIACYYNYLKLFCEPL